MRILLIDDDEDDRCLFQEAITQLSSDIICDVATNGEEGLKHLNSAATLPDIVFLDINMPIMNGREALSAIRKSPRLRNLYVVIYSTSNAWQDSSWFKLKSDNYLIKPSAFPELVHLLEVELSAFLIGGGNHDLIQRTC